MSWIAVGVTVGGAVLGGIMGKQKAPDYGPLAEAKKYEARLRYKASQENIAMFREQYEQTRNDHKPWRDLGMKSLAALDKGMKDGSFDVPEWKGFSGEDALKDDPGYQFRLQQGEQSIRRNAAAAAGGGMSGSTLKALQDFGQRSASQEFGAARARALGDRAIRQGDLDRQYNRHAGLAGTGMLATQNIASARNFYGQNAGQQRTAGANALGEGAVGAANAGILQQQANNRAKQQNYNNMLSGATVASKAYSGGWS